MKMIKSMVQLSLGAAFGVGMVLSCSDGSPDRTDAATCDCPASEAPLAGRVVTNEGEPQPIAAGARSGTSVQCPPGMQFLSGSCAAADPTLLEDIALIQFGFDKSFSSWFCDFKNNKTTTVMVRASVQCLKPAI
jgi:hypothetical protein